MENRDSRPPAPQAAPNWECAVCLRLQCRAGVFPRCLPRASRPRSAQPGILSGDSSGAAASFLFFKEHRDLEVAFFLFCITSLTNTDTLYLHNIVLARMGPHLQLPEYAFYSVRCLNVAALISSPACVLPLSYSPGFRTAPPICKLS